MAGVKNFCFQNTRPIIKRPPNQNGYKPVFITFSHNKKGDSHNLTFCWKKSVDIKSRDIGKKSEQRKGDSVKNKLDSLFFTRHFVPERHKVL